MTKRAKITKKGGYKCAPQGHTVVHFAEGTIVDGQVAVWAIADRAAQAMFNPVKENKVIAPTETKRRKRKSK